MYEPNLPSSQVSSQRTRLEVRRKVHGSKHNRVDADQPDHGEQPGSRPEGDQDAEDDRGQPSQPQQPFVSSPRQEGKGSDDLHDAGHDRPGRNQEEQSEGSNAWPEKGD